MDKVKTTIIKKDFDYKTMKNLCRVTDNKDFTDKDASDKFITKLLISEHSPIRTGRLMFAWYGLKSWVATHFARHGWEKYISTQRSDRTNIDRDKSPQDTPIDFVGELNTQHLIDTSRKRLCYCSSDETRIQMEDIKLTLLDGDSKLVSDVLVPNCVYRAGCPEFKNCGFWNKLNKDIPQKDNESIVERYERYNRYFLDNQK